MSVTVLKRTGLVLWGAVMVSGSIRGLVVSSDVYWYLSGLVCGTGLVLFGLFAATRVKLAAANETTRRAFAETDAGETVGSATEEEFFKELRSGIPAGGSTRVKW